MKKTLFALLLLAIAAALVAGFDLYAIRNLRGQIVTVTAPEYTAPGVLLQVYTGTETPTTRWLFLGSSDTNVTLNVDAPPASGIYYGASVSSVRHDRPFEVRILRKHLGFLWLPDRTVRFDVPADRLPTLTSGTQAASWATFKDRVASR